MSVSYGGDSITFADGSVQSGAWNGFRNRIINGAMVIDQRNAAASITPVDGQFSVDRWKFSLAQTSKFTAQQSTTAPTGFSNSLLITSSSAYSVLTGDNFNLIQWIEGYNTADLAWGTAAAVPVTLSFWVRSSLTGTFGGSIVNNNQNYSYPFTYTISSANTFEYKTITIPGPTSGTWSNTTTTRNIGIWIGLGAGASVSGTAGNWAAAGYYNATGATSLVGTSSATLYITGVQLERGSTASSFEYRPYGTELALCQRYYQMVVGTMGVGYSTTQTDFAIQFPQQMRASPTCTQAGSITVSDTVAADFTQSSTGFSSVDGPSVYGHHIRLNNFTGLTTYRPYIWRNTNSSNNILLYSSEL